jgi:hypothetical protein
MSNTHGTADTLKELQATDGDLLAPCILSTTWPVAPASSLTLAAFATYGYARSGRDLVFIDQPAVTVTLPSAAGTYWLGMHRDTSSAVSGWTRRDGSHYVFQVSASQPTPPDGVVLLSSVTVAGSIITAVAQTGILRAPMSRQDASAVAVTGGTATLAALAVTGNATVSGLATLNGLAVNGNATVSGTATMNGLAVNGNGTLSGLFTPSQLEVTQRVGIGTAMHGAARLAFNYPTTEYGLLTQPASAGLGTPLIFLNSGGTAVGSITVNDTGTAFNTSSDVRLKHSVTTLTGALERVWALRPVSFRWNVDDSPGESFLAHELMGPCPLAVSGLPDEVNEDGSIKPQQVDMSKIVPLLTAGLQAALAQIDALTARLSTLEHALGA